MNLKKLVGLLCLAAAPLHCTNLSPETQNALMLGLLKDLREKIEKMESELQATRAELELVSEKLGTRRPANKLSRELEALHIELKQIGEAQKRNLTTTELTELVAKLDELYVKAGALKAGADLITGINLAKALFLIETRDIENTKKALDLLQTINKNCTPLLKCEIFEAIGDAAGQLCFLTHGNPDYITIAYEALEIASGLLREQLKNPTLESGLRKELEKRLIKAQRMLAMYGQNDNMKRKSDKELQDNAAKKVKLK